MEVFTYCTTLTGMNVKLADKEFSQLHFMYVISRAGRYIIPREKCIFPVA